MKVDTLAGFTGAHLELIAQAERACKAIPPLWPLSSSVAVNPFLGQTDRSLSEVEALLGRVGGVQATMPNGWYLARIRDGRISDDDLAAALAASPDAIPGGIDALKAQAAAPDTPAQALPTVADLAAAASGIDWPRLIADRIGAWAAGHFDTGQALWQATPGRDAFDSWQVFASRDLTPEIAGLSGFAGLVAGLPMRGRTALSLACDALALPQSAAPTYFHQLLLGLGGWSQLARQRLWQAELQGQRDTTTGDLLAIRLVWEQALFAQNGDRIGAAWATTCATHANPPAATPAQLARAALQEAAERAAQRGLAQVLAAPATATPDERPTLQAAFCIDVRSEVFRRALESTGPGIRTLGFAGFFGLTAAHRDFASDVVEARLPVLLTAGVHSSASGPEAADTAARLSARASRAWGRFKLAAVSSFAFVEATGPLYAGKLLRDALGMGHGGTAAPPRPQFSDDLTLTERTLAAGRILRAMSLTDGFAPLVLLIGHGAGVVNNPHASALHCGACGGYAGDVNARLLAGLLNDLQVRQGLASDGIDIPADTLFLGGLHDTTTDEVTLFDTGDAGPDHASALRNARAALAAAGKIARTERVMRLPRATNGNAIRTRSTDWAETRPEWALAGCQAFIAAPRARTRGKGLAGRAFLHDYDWTKDNGFGVLELILTAPVVVASWISLQYYGSVVAPQVFGGGNKLLHNVTGGIGVVEGNGGTLRGGLPWQSVHDGQDFAHEPLRLTVCVEAPAAAVADILDRHPQVRALFDNRWLHLVLLDGLGRMTDRYVGNLSFERFHQRLHKAA